MFRNYTAFLGVLAATILAAIPAAAASSGVPGTLNYVEGQVTVAGQTVTSHSVGSVQVEPNQTLETGQGKAEMLLTPGVFLRVGDNSAVRLVSASDRSTGWSLGAPLTKCTRPGDPRRRGIVSGRSCSCP